jgi:hypothetical protein
MPPGYEQTDGVCLSGRMTWHCVVLALRRNGLSNRSSGRKRIDAALPLAEQAEVLAKAVDTSGGEVVIQ